MDEYLEEEIEYTKNSLNEICASWEKQVKSSASKGTIRAGLTLVLRPALQVLRPSQKRGVPFCLHLTPIK